MYIHHILFLFLHLSPALALSTHTFRRAVDHVRRVALRQSIGLPHDLHIALSGLVRRDQDQKVLQVKCKAPTAAHPVVTGISPGSIIYPNSWPSSISIPGNSLPLTTTTATSSSGSNSTGATTTSSSATPTPTSPWKLVESHQGNTFFVGWDFSTGPDSSTSGVVVYVDQATGQSSGILGVNPAGNAIMAVESTPKVQSTRMSIRITTQSNYNGGALVLMDSVHMPTGCATWPAFWMNGPNWPAGGEIDIVEGINNWTNNQMTLHTVNGCNLPSGASTSSLGITGNVLGTSCIGNTGCGIASTSSNTFGVNFNNQSGGVYGMEWNSTGIAIWFFPRNSIPSDITAGAPLPAGWGVPMAFFPGSNCNPFQFFKGLSAIFDTTLCGALAGSAWTGSGAPGQAQSCAQQTGFSTCEAFVAASGSSFVDAYWEVSYVKIYQT